MTNTQTHIYTLLLSHCHNVTTSGNHHCSNSGSGSYNYNLQLLLLHAAAATDTSYNYQELQLDGGYNVKTLFYFLKKVSETLRSDLHIASVTDPYVYRAPLGM